MHKSVNKLMRYPLRDDIPSSTLPMSEARPMTNATSLRGLTMYTITTYRNSKVHSKQTATNMGEAQLIARFAWLDAQDLNAETVVRRSVPKGSPIGTISTKILFRVDKDSD